MTDKEFKNLIEKAIVAANDAGDKWVAEHTRPVFGVVDSLSGKTVGYMLDSCGFGYIKFSDKRSSFYKKAKKFGYAAYTALNIPHNYKYRQEWSLNEATAYAAIGVLKAAGVNGIYVYSNID